MKIRTGFVSNSSSSSFIVIGNGKKKKVNKNPFKYGERNFSYGTFDSVSDKLNFVFLQYYYSNENEKIQTVLKEFCDKYGLDFDKLDKQVNALAGNKADIDHQSTIYEAPEMYDLFTDLDTLERFILCEDTTFFIDHD